MGYAFTIVPTVAANQRSALEHLLYFNVNQDRMRLGIQKSIKTYGIPEITENNGQLTVCVGGLSEVATLFAVSEHGHPMGVVVFARLAPTHVVVLHVGVLPRLRSGVEINAQVLLELIQEVHRVAKRVQGAERVEVVYSQRQGTAAIAPSSSG